MSKVLTLILTLVFAATISAKTINAEKIEAHTLSENLAKKNYITSSIEIRSEAQNASEIQAIFVYIQKYHPEISSTDAKQIATELVLQSGENNIDPKFVAAIIGAESGFNKTAKSRSGAKGLGQLMSSTYAKFKVQNPFDIKQNVYATIQYVKNIVDQWDGHSMQLTYALATYLRGEFAVKRSNGNFSPFTTKYIGHVFKRYNTLCEIKNNTLIPQE